MGADSKTEEPDTALVSIRGRRRGWLARRSRRAPRQLRYRWTLPDVEPEQLLHRVLEGADGLVAGPLRVEPADPQAPGRYRGPSRVLMFHDEARGRVQIGIMAGPDRRVFAPVMEIQARKEPDGVTALGVVRRSFPDGVVGLLGLGMATLAFGGVVSVVMALGGMWVPAAVSLAVAVGVFGSTYALSDVALRTVNTRGVHQRLVERVQRALEESPSRTYR